MADNDLIVNELLFFVQNKFGCRPFDVLQGILINFYSEESICAAKRKLHDVASRLLGDNAICKLKDRRPGDSKKRLDTQDILELYTKLDKEKAKLPLFVAASLAKIPGDTPAECDVSTFAASVSELKVQLAEVQRAVSSLVSNAKQAPDGKKPIQALHFFPELEGKRLTVNMDNLSTSKAVVDNDFIDDFESETDRDGNEVGSTSYASVLRNNNQKWKYVGKSKSNDQSVGKSKAAKKQKAVYGCKDVSGMTSKLKAVHAVRTWHCKVSRFGEGTSNSDVADYMRELGVEALKVETLPRQGDAPLSVHLVIPYDAKDMVMQDKFWPPGIRVGGWHFARTGIRHDEHSRE